MSEDKEKIEQIAVEIRELESMKRLMERLEMITDPRKRRGIRYKLSDILLMAVYSVLSGYSEGQDVAFYAELNEQYFKNLLGIKKIPSHDTFSRIMQMVDFKELAEHLSAFLKENFEEICTKYGEYRLLHVDGKAVKAASAKSAGEKPKYLMNAMYEGEAIGLELSKVGNKENEISVLPEFLSRFNLKDTIVTMDAMGCNNTVINAIHDGGGKYVLPVKDNQKKLKAIIDEHVKQLEQEGKFDKLEANNATKKEHGRIDTYEVHLVKDTSFIYEKIKHESCFQSVARIGVIDKKTSTIKDGEYVTTTERKYVISDLEDISAANMLNIRLAHWHVEMQHWLLDIQLDEDRKTARKGCATMNGAILRRFCLRVQIHDEEYGEKPLKRFIQANRNNINRIEQMLFGGVAQE